MPNVVHFNDGVLAGLDKPWVLSWPPPIRIIAGSRDGGFIAMNATHVAVEDAPPHCEVYQRIDLGPDRATYERTS